MNRKHENTLKVSVACLYDVLKVGTLVSVASILSQGHSSPKLLKGFIGYGASRIRQALREQKLHGFIQYDEEDEYSPIILTEKGFLRSTKYVLSDIFRIKWDHFWRLIIFDIPEKKKVRQKFQTLLKKIGCFQIQKSVYVYPHDCKKEILRLASSIHASAFVDILTVPHLGRNEKTVREFYFNREKH